MDGLEQPISINIELRFPQRNNAPNKKPRVRCSGQKSKCKKPDPKCTHRALERRARRYGPVRSPNDPTEGLSAQFVAILEDMPSFYDFVPSRLGHNEAVDCAARAVTKVYRRRQVSQDPMDREIPQEYIRAVKSLRNSLDASDNSLIVVMLLVLFERIVREESTLVMAHLRGLTALLKSRAATDKESDIVRAVLYDNKGITHWIPLYTRSVSPFEDDRWLYLNAVASNTVLPAPISRLAQFGYQLQLRLPRLVNYVRSLKECQGDVSPYDTISLATELVALQDVEAENEVLHRIRVGSTKDTTDNAIVPWSMTFNSIEEFDAATGYWHGRIFLGRLCLVLSLLPDADRSSLAFNMSSLKTESHRMMANLFMSIQYAESCGIFIKRRHAQILKVCMRILSGFSEFRGLPICRVRSWLAEKIWSAEQVGKLNHALLSMTETCLQNCP